MIAIGNLLLKEKNDRGMMKFLAGRLEVTSQTLRNWRRIAELEQAPRIGRPRYREELKAKARVEISAEMERQGYPGWRPISEALAHLPIRLVQSEVAAIKQERELRAARAAKKRRETVTVHARESIWTIDGTQVGRAGGKAVDVQLAKDRASLSPRLCRIGLAPKADDIVELLEEAADELPLVIASDNGSAYVSKETGAWLKENKVIHLKSLPRTPQHNGAIEVAIRETKEALQISTAAKLDSVEAMSNDLRAVLESIRQHRPRASKGYKTSAVLDEELPRAYDLVDRNLFYEKCSRRLSEVAIGTMNWRERRLREREVIYETLEEYGLITRTRGLRASSA